MGEDAGHLKRRGSRVYLGIFMAGEVFVVKIVDCKGMQVTPVGAGKGDAGAALSARIARSGTCFW